MFFQVRSNDGEQIQIAPYKVAGAGANLTLISALSAAGLPMEGDFLSIANAGAYCYSMGGIYNLRAMPPEVVILNGEAKLVRPRVSSKDLADSILNESILQ